jgi:signal transduction histidine kinase
MQPNDPILALLFQTLCTITLAAVHYGLWRQRRQSFHATWALAWTVYAARLLFISLYLNDRQLIWLFAHQVVTGWAGLLLLWAALQFSQRLRWHMRYLWLGLLSIAWAWYAVFVMRSMATAGMTSAVLLSGVTLGTGAIFWMRVRRAPSLGARVLAWSFTLWGLHHLDYPLLRALGSDVQLGVFMDVSLIIATAVGTLTLVLGEERAALAQRTAQLEQLTRLLLRAQEEERKRIARELHDEAGQTLTALKIGFDLRGETDASAQVATVLGQIRNLSELLRPQALDDLGLVPALRALAQDITKRTQIQVTLDADDTAHWPPDVAAALYRVAQEALTNVARHSGATHAWVQLETDAEGIRLIVEDDGHGAPADPRPHLGLLGMRERMTLVGGDLKLGPASRGGLRVEATLPAPGEPS